MDKDGKLPSHRIKVKDILESIGREHCHHGIVEKESAASVSDYGNKVGESHVQSIGWNKVLYKFDGLFSRAEELEDELMLLRPPDVEEVSALSLSSLSSSSLSVSSLSL